MADFAIWSTAAEVGLGFPSGTFEKAYARTRGAAHDLALEVMPIVPYIRQLVENGGWSGTASELLQQIILSKLTGGGDEGTIAHSVFFKRTSSIAKTEVTQIVTHPAKRRKTKRGTTKPSGQQGPARCGMQDLRPPSEGGNRAGFR
jgi:hypothetical protein